MREWRGGQWPSMASRSHTRSRESGTREKGIWSLVFNFSFTHVSNVIFFVLSIF